MALGAGLGRPGKKCLLVDLDPQGHSTLGLDVEIADGEPTIREFFNEPPVPMSRLIRKTHLPSLHLVPATIRLAPVAQSLYMRPKREELLRRG
jgi:chromosome partitioning protein